METQPVVDALGRHPQVEAHLADARIESQWQVGREEQVGLKKELNLTRREALHCLGQRLRWDFEPNESC